jgi:glutamine synthetase
MGASREDLRARAESDGIEFFFAMFVDMHGKPCAKLVPAESFDVLMDGGAGLPGSPPARWVRPRPTRT